MTDRAPPLPAREGYAEALVEAGFSDNGERLRGPVRWTDTTGAPRTTRIEVRFDERFPFAPPVVRVVDPDGALELTFHLERPDPEAVRGVSGNLCLWESDVPVEHAPWLSPSGLLARVAGWLEQTDAGWPGDEACDLERYLPQSDDVMVLYRSDQLTGLDRTPVQVEPGPNGTVSVTGRAAHLWPKKGTRRRRRDTANAWLEDVGELSRPLSSWAEVREVLHNPGDVRLAVFGGAIRYLLLRYRRGCAASVLVLRVKRAGDDIVVEACAAADEAPAALQLRAGAQAAALADLSVAVIGCGAVGSFAAEVLYRSGVREIGLYDYDQLRPGNVVRHLGTLEDVGRLKADVVRDRVEAVGGDLSGVHARFCQLRTLELARRLVSGYDIVLDATANARAGSLLAVAAQEAPAPDGAVVISVCVQRQGEVVRVDRLPLRPGETHLPPLPLLEGAPVLADAGCGSPVSITPPTAVWAAALLAVETVVGEALQPGTAAPSVAEVRRAQPEQEFSSLGRVQTEAVPMTETRPGGAPRAAVAPPSATDPDRTAIDRTAPGQVDPFQVDPGQVDPGQIDSGVEPAT